MKLEKVSSSWKSCDVGRCWEKATYQCDESLAFCTPHAIEMTTLSLPLPRVKIVPFLGTNKFRIHWEERALWLPIAGGKVEEFTLNQICLIVELLEKLS